MSQQDAAPVRHQRFHPDPETIERIVQAVRSIRYGVVQIVIQDARVVQIEKTEKIRLQVQPTSPLEAFKTTCLKPTKSA